MKRSKLILLVSVLVLAMVLFCSCGSEECVHEFADGVCTACGTPDPDYVAPCAHEFADGICTACGEADPDYVPPCTHSFSGGACTACGEECKHTYDDGVCSVCGFECEHVYRGGVCAKCLKVCDHDYEEGVCNVCGFEDPDYVKIIGKRDPAKTYNILFIGNSFTYYNKMPSDLFAPMCAAAGYTVNVEAITKGGYYLDKFANPSDEKGALVYEALTTKSYDIVILQEQSLCPLSNPTRFYDGCRSLAALVKNNGAELWYYQSWGYKEGHEKLPNYGGTTAEMEKGLRAAYETIAEETGGKVIYAGSAMLDIYTNQNIEVYDADLYHPSAYGSALIAYTIFGAIFEGDPRELPYNVAGGNYVSSLLKEAAYKASVGRKRVLEAPEDLVIKDRPGSIIDPSELIGSKKKSELEP